MTQKRILIFGFSNVAVLTGFSVPLMDRLTTSHPDVDVVRIGLGALQPHIVPPYLRMAFEQHGPFTDVLFEINASAFPLHPLASEGFARELLLDTIHTAAELGAQFSFVSLYRNWNTEPRIDFNAITETLCAQFNIPYLDLAEKLVAEKGSGFVNGLLRDTAHTTPEGSEFLAERIAAFVTENLDRDQNIDLAQAPLPEFRRHAMDLRNLMPELTQETRECSALALPYTVMSGDDHACIDLGQTVKAMGLSFLYHAGGGHADLVLNEDEKPVRLTSVDPFSYFTRIGVMPFKSYHGTDLRRLKIGQISDAAEVTLLRREKTTPPTNYIGPLIVLRPAV